MADVVPLSSEQAQSSWTTMFVVLLFLTVDVGITVWLLYATVITQEA